MLIKRNISTESLKPVNVMLQCSPLMKLPLGITLGDDLVRRNDPNAPHGVHFFKGDVLKRSTPWRNTVGQPFIHGDIAEQLRLQQFQAAPAVVNALKALGASATVAAVKAAIVCAVGGVPTLGLACAGAGAVAGGIVLAGIAAAATSVVKDLIDTQINRVKAMGNADWFIWSDTRGVFWNSFGDITDTWINPSITNPNVLPTTDHIRIGVEYSNVPVGGGPDFSEATPSAEKLGTRHDVRLDAGLAGLASGPESYEIATPTQSVLTGPPGDTTLIGGPKTDVIRAGAGTDMIMAGAGNKTVYGGPGNDTIYAGRGNQVIDGGPGTNLIVGGAGYDILRGGRGTDTIVDLSGRARVLTGGDNGPGRDYVFVRDGRGGDTVICGSRRSTVFADANDTVIGCGRVITTGPTFRGRSPRTP